MNAKTVKYMQKNTRKTTLGYRSIFVLTSFRVTALAKQSIEEMDWHLGFAWLTHSEALNTPNTI